MLRMIRPPASVAVPPVRACDPAGCAVELAPRLPPASLKHLDVKKSILTSMYREPRIDVTTSERQAWIQTYLSLSDEAAPVAAEQLWRSQQLSAHAPLYNAKEGRNQEHMSSNLFSNTYRYNIIKYKYCNHQRAAPVAAEQCWNN